MHNTFSKTLLLIILTTLFSGYINAQQTYTISGKISDSQTGEDLIGASAIETSSNIGASANTYGFYSLELSKGKHILEFSFIGYNSITKEITLNKDTKINIELSQAGINIEEVVVVAEKKNSNVTSTAMSIEKIDISKVEKLPVMFGEKDVLKTIQLLPGISTASEGSSGFSVRGGSIDQNLILLDEAPVYSASHLMGFFSVFNSDALKNMAVYKGGIPAKYGGRASSVLDITMKDGNSRNFSASGGIGLISSRLTIEGPIINNKMSFVVSGRRSYADLIGKASGQLENDMSLYFYDLNAKINYRVNENNRIFISGYFGQDDFGFNNMGMNWGNSTATLRWNHLYNSKLFSNTTLIYSDYSYAFNFSELGNMSSGIEDFNIKQDFTWFYNPKNTIKFGLNSTHHTFNPGKFTTGSNIISDIEIEEKKAIESAIYISNDSKITDNLSADYGLRLTMFNQLGAGWSKTYDDINTVTDSTYFGAGQIMKSYFEYEPRLSLSYQLSDYNSIKASYNRMAQYLHLLSNSTSGQPTDTWVPSTANVKPLIVNQFAIGYFRNFFDNNIEFSVETYYKDLHNVTDYEDGTSTFLNSEIESQILTGEGRSYGAEFYLKKKYGKFTGWVSYTLSRTENKIEGINNFNWYTGSIDKTHDVSVVASYQLTSRLSIAATWIYYTGNAVTFPSGKYIYNNNYIPYYTGRNGYRMPEYHRLDINFHLEGKQNRKFKSSWDFSLYNAYNRKNAYSIDFRESETNPGTTEAVKLSLFGIVPSITWNFKF